jgi:predicted CXXCH cytochrome family protein
VRWLGFIVGWLVAGAALAGDSGRTPLPVIEPATPGTSCVADPAFMRRNHMDLLKHQRDDTVHGGIRGAKYSLKDCIDCHASLKTKSVTQGETNFCTSCHNYAAVAIDCFGCHSSAPRAQAKVVAR